MRAAVCRPRDARLACLFQSPPCRTDFNRSTARVVSGVDTGAESQYRRYYRVLPPVCG